MRGRVICSPILLPNTLTPTAMDLAITIPTAFTAISARGTTVSHGVTATGALIQMATVQVTLPMKARSLSGTSATAPMFGRLTQRNGWILTGMDLATTNPTTQPTLTASPTEPLLRTIRMEMDTPIIGRPCTTARTHKAFKSMPVQRYGAIQVSLL